MALIGKERTHSPVCKTFNDYRVRLACWRTGRIGTQDRPPEELDFSDPGAKMYQPLLGLGRNIPMPNTVTTSGANYLTLPFTLRGSKHS